MKKFLEKFPLPISGLALGMAALGNLVRSYGEIYRSIFGVLSFIIIVLLTIKILMNFGEFRKNMENPVIS